MLNRVPGQFSERLKRFVQLPQRSQMAATQRRVGALASPGILPARARQSVSLSNGGALRPGRFRTVAAAASGGTGTNSFCDAMVNGTIVASVGSSALTVSIKTLAGLDPSAGDPVHVFTRSATAANGDYTDTTLTGTLSLTISSGSTMGASNGVPFRLWLVFFNDSATPRLGLINCLSGTDVIALPEDTVQSSTAEGGAGAADSAQTIYTGTAVTSKPFRILGYLEWSSGLATAGTWASTPTRIQLASHGTKKPGDVVQMRRNSTASVSSGTTQLPYDDTIPQNTEGDQYLTQAITPTSAANVLRVRNGGVWNTNTGSRLTVALFQDSTANALAAIVNAINASTDLQALVLEHAFLSATTSSTTLKIRAGCNTVATTTINGEGGARRMGGVMASYLEISEIMA